MRLVGVCVVLRAPGGEGLSLDALPLLKDRGAIDQSTMGIIREAYAWVEAREAWCVDTQNRAEIALMSVEAASRPILSDIPGKSVLADGGAMRVLLESKFLFDVVDLESDLSPYALVILPDAVEVGPEIKAKVDAFVAGGGRVLLTGRSGIDAEQGCVFDTGAEWLGTSGTLTGAYELLVKDLRSGFVNDPLLMYGPAEKLMLKDGESLGEDYEPYFDRTRRHFSGHINTPSKPDPEAYVGGARREPSFSSPSRSSRPTSAPAPSRSWRSRRS